MVAQKDCAIMAIYLNKKKVYTHLQDEKQILYNYVTNILLDRICTKKIIPTSGPVTLIASKRETNKFLNDNFVRYLNSQAGSNHAIDLKVEIKTHSEDKVLQVVDFISWAIFRKYEHQDESYREFIKKKIVEENALFS